jgi:hypothetical protein
VGDGDGEYGRERDGYENMYFFSIIQFSGNALFMAVPVFTNGAFAFVLLSRVLRRQKNAA